MPLPSTGQTIKLSDIQTEYGGNNPINISEYYNNSTYVINDNTIPTNGTISLSNFAGKSKKIVYIITSSETFVLSGNYYCEILIVGGGGSGGYGIRYNAGGGGGGGGIYHIPRIYLQKGNYPIIIGKGGDGMVYESNNGNDGQYSSITIQGITYSANGGGGGGASTNYNANNYNNYSATGGGSGGGGSGSMTYDASGTAITGVGGTGGGNGSNGTHNYYGNNGYNASYTLSAGALHRGFYGGNGGSSYPAGFSITGETIVYGAGGGGASYTPTSEYTPSTSWNSNQGSSSSAYGSGSGGCVNRASINARDGVVIIKFL